MPAIVCGAGGARPADAAVTSPFHQLSPIPLFTLCAVHAPKGRAASSFALMASLMSLALVAGGLISKYLNQIFVVERGQYEKLPALFAIVLLIGFVIPVTVIRIFGKRVQQGGSADRRCLPISATLALQ